MNFPLVSIAMPVYNAEKYVKQAVESILNQTYPHFELIIIDDGSSDSSKEIILSFKDSRIKFLENLENQGIAKTRNRCIENASGKYVAVLDNDDISMPQRLEKQIGFLEANNEYVICGTFYEIIDGAGRLVNKMKLPVTYNELKTYLLFENCFCNSSVMILTSLLREWQYAESFDMIEDYYFLYSVSRLKKLAILPEYETQYRVHGNNTSIEKMAGMKTLRSKMDLIILGNLGIQFSDKEFCMHTNFATAQFNYFDSNSRISELESWLIKLHGFLESTGQYDMNMIERIFIRRWIFVFTRRRKFSKKLFINKLSLKFKAKYLLAFCSLSLEKYSKIKTVS